jgi:hypothetical protein
MTEKAMSKKSEQTKLQKYFPWLLTGGGLIGLLSAFVLMVEKIEVLKNPDYVPSCNINPILACGSVINTPQASVFGFPKPCAWTDRFHCSDCGGSEFARWHEDYQRVVLAHLLGGDDFWGWICALAVFSVSLADRRAVPVLHGGVDGNDSDFLVYHAMDVA